MNALRHPAQDFTAGLNKSPREGDPKSGPPFT
jgi:hypothetical protein